MLQGGSLDGAAQCSGKLVQILRQIGQLCCRCAVFPPICAIFSIFCAICVLAALVGRLPLAMPELVG